MSEPQLGPVVLAMDPFAELPAAASNAASMVRILSPKKTELAYVMSPESLNWEGGANRVYLDRVRTSALKAMMRKSVKGATGRSILVNMKPSRQNDVEFLCGFAKKKKADLIVLQTHGRKGVKRMFLGSFTEAALNKSRIPLLILSPQAKVPRKLKRVLVPMDLSPRTVTSFKKSLPLLKRMGLEVVLYNKVSDPIEPVVQSGVMMMGGGWVGFDQYRRTDLSDRQKALQKLVDFVKGQGLEASGIVEERFGSILELVQKAAKRLNCQVIMTGTQTGNVGAALWGSVTRSLARESKLPLLVYPIR